MHIVSQLIFDVFIPMMVVAAVGGPAMMFRI